MEREVLILILAHLIYLNRFVELARKKRFGGVGMNMLLVLVSQQYGGEQGKSSTIYALILETGLLLWSIYNVKSFEEWKENHGIKRD